MLAAAIRRANHPYPLWALLTVPALYILYLDLQPDAKEGRLLYLSGIYSVRLLVLTMAITPLAMLFRGRGWVRWLKARRRYFGVASFGYALLHLAYYFKTATLEAVLNGFARIEILTGWIAFAIMLAMAVTSNDRAVRAMGPGWKALQRWVYLGAALVFAHYLLVERNWAGVLLEFSPLIALSLYRVLRPRVNPGRRGA